jgi:hypothetical protein
MKTPMQSDQLKNKILFAKNVLPYGGEKKEIIRKIFWLAILLLLYAGILFA